MGSARRSRQHQFNQMIAGQNGLHLFQRNLARSEPNQASEIRRVKSSILQAITQQRFDLMNIPNPNLPPPWPKSGSTA